MDMAARFARCLVMLKNGREIDLSGLTGAEAAARLAAARVTYDDVRGTVTEVHSSEQLAATRDLERLTVQ